MGLETNFPCSCGWQSRWHNSDCIYWTLKNVATQEEILLKLDHLHDQVCKKCVLCDCNICDCQKRIDKENDTFTEFKAGSIACGKCWQNHGECLLQTCRHVSCG